MYTFMVSFMNTLLKDFYDIPWCSEMFFVASVY